MKKAAFIFGVTVCVAGVVLAYFWLIAMGCLLLVASTFLPNATLSSFATFQSTSIKYLISFWVCAVGLALILVTILGVWANVDAFWPLISWSAGLLLLLFATSWHDFPHLKPTQLKRLLSLEIVILLLLTIAALFLRIHKLETLPPMHGDEGEMGVLALRVLAAGENLPPFTTGFLDHPTLFHYLQAGSMRLFGQTVSGLRMVSAIFGALCIPAIYAVGRLGWGRIVGLMAAAILASSHVHIHFSRLGLNNIHSVFMGILLVLCLLWADRSLTKDRVLLTPWLAMGLVTGLAQYFYYGSRLLPVLLIPFLAMLLWRHRPPFRLILLVPLGCLAAWLPLVPRFIQVPATFLSRQTGVNVFLDPNIRAIVGESASAFDILLFQAERNLRFFVDSGDVSSFYFGGVPGLNMFAAVLFWIGLILALSKLRFFPNVATLIWFGLGLLLGGILTNTSPAATRLVMIYPAIALMGGVAVDRVFALVRTFDNASGWWQYGLVILIAGLLAQSDYRTYFRHYAANPPQAHMVAVGRELAKHAPSADTFLLGAPILFVEHGTIRFLMQPLQARNLASIDDLAEADNMKPNLFVIGLGPYEEELQALQQRLPGGEIRQVDGVNGQVLYYSYLVEH